MKIKQNRKEFRKNVKQWDAKPSDSIDEVVPVTDRSGNDAGQFEELNDQLIYYIQALEEERKRSRYYEEKCAFQDSKIKSLE